MIETMTAIDTIKTIPIIIFILSGMFSNAILARMFLGRKRISPVVTPMPTSNGDNFLNPAKSLSNVASILISTPMLCTPFLLVYCNFLLLHSPLPKIFLHQRLFHQFQLFKALLYGLLLLVYTLYKIIIILLN